MSHFSTIQTKIKNKPQLLEALELLQYNIQEDQELINPTNHQHEKVKVDVSIGNDIGFRLNSNGEYELVADIETWNQDVPIERFIDKVSQQYAVEVISRETKKAGWDEESLEVNDKQEIELVVSRWV